MTEAGFPYSYEELLRRAVQCPTNPYQTDLPRWAVMKSVFGVGSTVGRLLCHRFQVNPDDVIKGQQGSEEGA